VITDLEELRARLVRTGDTATSWADLAAGLVPALVQVGRDEEAREVAEVALRHAYASGIPRSIADGLRVSALAHADGPDVDQLREAAAIYERIGARGSLSRTLFDIGAALRRRRQPAAAREPLRRALDIARAGGARPLAERAEHELRAAGARPRRDRITGRDALTGTELRVAHLAIEGMTNRQIAEALFVTKKTVESHLDHVFHKLGIHARGELQRALVATGELS
jgi:DNA-binding CsgD family transcriptional regulator